MFEKIKLKERALEKEEALEIIQTGSYGVLSTIGENGYPYGIPLNYSYVNGCICFHSALEGHKISNLNFNRNASFCVVTKSTVHGNEFDTAYKSAVAFGKAAVVTQESEKKEILVSLLKKYSSDSLKAGYSYMKKHWHETKIIKIEIEHLSGKANKEIVDP